ncbi:YebC/PmpR family DNA-binding transcriptional regulator, partial [Acinetobacter baumannii]
KDSFAEVRDHLAKHFGDNLEAKLIWRPLNLIACDVEMAPGLIKLMDILEDNDDVQDVYANFDIAEDVLTQLA